MTYCVEPPSSRESPFSGNNAPSFSERSLALDVAAAHSTGAAMHAATARTNSNDGIRISIAALLGVEARCDPMDRMLVLPGGLSLQTRLIAVRRRVSSARRPYDN